MKTFIAILSMLPSIITAVQALEAMAPIPQAGKDKLNVILKIAGSVGGDAEKMIPIITDVIGHVVSFANAFGLLAPKPTSTISVTT